MTKSTTRSTADGEFLSGLDVTGALTADTITKVSTGDLDLLPISTTITDTAVDVFIYDTSKDSDGGAWRKRTQGTSWYNETLNTSTRGSRKEFPAVAVIVAEASKVTIYDGDDPAMPMWMVFNVNGQRIIRAGTDVKSVQMTNGVFVVGASGYGLSVISFIEDNAYLKTGSHYTWADPTIAHRNINTVFTPTAGVSGIVSSVCNDIAMTILPNAPIDSATGLPTPTIAVATNGGVSVIKDDGSVVDITGQLQPIMEISFTDKHQVAVSGHYRNWLALYNIPTSDVASTTYISQYTHPKLIGTDSSTGSALKAIASYSDTVAVGQNQGVTVIDDTLEDENKNSIAYITSDYNTGYMVGDIKLAALSDTDATDVVGTELVTNGTFDSDLTGWAAAYPATPPTWNAAGYIYQSNPYGNTARTGFKQELTGLVVGSQYVITCNVITNSGILQFRGGSVYGADLALQSTGIHSHSFTATATAQWVGLTVYRIGYGTTMEVDDFSVVLADTDRSVNATGLAVHGTITKSAVATGADLVAYSGFSASNYLEQPYNSDLDFGTGDFSIMGWCKLGTADATAIYTGTTSSNGINVWCYNTEIKIYVAGQYMSFNSTPYIGSNFAHFTMVRRSGALFVYTNGELSVTVGAAGSIVYNTMKFGYGAYSGGGTLALWRISATAPTAAQIKTIYEAEKPLFQENAQATLYGTSDAVTALAHDSDTDLLHVGTSSGRSVFQGLRRVDNTTTAVGAAISASNGLVVED